MIIMRLKGGLGNQLFQFAYGLELALNYKKKLILDILFYKGSKQREFLLDALGLHDYYLIKSKFLFLIIRFLSKLSILKFFCADYKFDDGLRLNLDLKKTCLNYLDGYFQSEIYFERVKKNLIEKLRACTLLTNFDNNTPNKVAIHIRRGDYLKETKYVILGDEYYIKAINTMKSRVKSPTFYIFSDDISYCKNLFCNYKDFHYINTNNTLEDFKLMSNCHHFIIANSTYSWWASAIGQKHYSIIVAPKHWYKSETIDTYILYRTDWIIL